jgi:hypothetical protein
VPRQTAPSRAFLSPRSRSSRSFAHNWERWRKRLSIAGNAGVISGTPSGAVTSSSGSCATAAWRGLRGAASWPGGSRLSAWSVVRRSTRHGRHRSSVARPAGLARGVPGRPPPSPSAMG